MRRYLIALHLPAGGWYCCFSGFDRKTFRTSSLFTITYNFALRSSLSFSRYIVKSEICCLEEKAHFSQSWKDVASEEKADFLRSWKAVANGSGYNHNFISFSHLRGAQSSRQTVRLLYFAIFTWKEIHYYVRTFQMEEHHAQEGEKRQRTRQRLYQDR